ncbi:aminotransferase class I/II-fold pyridoxal phosphate-dependent enzyme [Halobacillus yeomjeoni]|uniref:Aminotransferase n=1 Tax=Halobacillus yeomjeoni TaxID=311194 RepID=A0A931MTS1_9BACI|nr:aminotransferase class I/II-fold pyridoxal phosphate-dependent enzyme [Halobacillus yeomjeoni]MBH0228912.1 aminotransferase class I/II-fold pyridoxal phosphate-dependent enzyme [Halobacillus yeomjeoni]
MEFGSSQVNSLPPYLFSIFQQKKRKLQEKGVDVIDLGIGAPDLPTPAFIIDRLIREVQNPQNHRYSPYGGCREFKEAVASFYQKHYGVSLDPDTEVMALVGSKEGIAHMIHAVIDPGDGVLIPDPGYPVYRSAVHLAKGKVISLPLNEERAFRPDFDSINEEDLQCAKVLLVNYPSNPTGATVSLETFKEVFDFAAQHQLCIMQDSAYDLVTFEDYKAPSLLQVPGAKHRSVEFGSLSKSFNMTGWRIGYVVGNEALIRALAVVKSNTDTSQFLAIQKAAAEALISDFRSVHENNQIYKERMEWMHTALKEIGMAAEKPRGTFFIWAKVPEGFSSQTFAEKMLDEAGVILTPGTAFGPNGEGFVRISLSVPIERLVQAVERMKRVQTEGDRG